MAKIEVKGVTPAANALEAWASKHGKFKNVTFKNVKPKEWFSEKGNLFINYNDEAFMTPAQLIYLQLKHGGASIVKYVEHTTGTGNAKKGTGVYDILEVNADGKLTINLDKESTPSLVG